MHNGQGQSGNGNHKKLHGQMEFIVAEGKAGAIQKNQFEKNQAKNDQEDYHADFFTQVGTPDDKGSGQGKDAQGKSKKQVSGGDSKTRIP